MPKNIVWVGSTLAFETQPLCMGLVWNCGSSEARFLFQTQSKLQPVYLRNHWCTKCSTWSEVSYDTVFAYIIFIYNAEVRAKVNVNTAAEHANVLAANSWTPTKHNQLVTVHLAQLKHQNTHINYPSNPKYYIATLQKRIRSTSAKNNRPAHVKTTCLATNQPPRAELPWNANAT